MSSSDILKGHVLDIENWMDKLSRWRLLHVFELPHGPSCQNCKITASYSAAYYATVRSVFFNAYCSVFSVRSGARIPKIIWAAPSEFGTYRLCEQRRFRRACASAQSRQNLRCSLIQAVNQEEPSDRKPDPWPLWMAGHARLKFVMTECSKTQIRLARPIFTRPRWLNVARLIMLQSRIKPQILRLQCLKTWHGRLAKYKLTMLQFWVSILKSFSAISSHQHFTDV